MERRMAEPDRVLDELWKLGFELSAALKVVDQHKNTIATTQNAKEARQLEAAVIETRILAERLERELSYLEYLAARPNEGLDDLSTKEFY
jgi:hypothetical protein